MADRLPDGLPDDLRFGYALLRRGALDGTFEVAWQVQRCLLHAMYGTTGGISHHGGLPEPTQWSATLAGLVHRSDDNDAGCYGLSVMQMSAGIGSVSVVIPHYGDPAHADALVGQLMSQVGAPEFEIIIVDDASPQPYPDDSRVRLIRRPVNGGFGAAVNAGVAAARHPYLLVLNSDLSIGETFVADFCGAAAPFQPAVVGPMVVGHDGASQWAGRKFPRTSHYFVEWLTILARYKDTRWRHAAIGHDVRAVRGATVAVDWVMGAAMLIPTADFRAVAGFDERFHMNCEEVDLQRRLRSRGVPSIFAGTVTAVHAGGASSGDQRERVRRLVESRLRYASKWSERPGVLRAALLAASVINMATNTIRRFLGAPISSTQSLQREFSVVMGREKGAVL